ncbi:MAG: hypothetical protein ACREO8_02225 [Luteimonas sp.]
MTPSMWFKSYKAATTLVACLVLSGCGGAALYSDLEEQQANQVMAALLGSGIGASKAPSPSKKGWEIRIASADFPAAMQILHARGLPQRESPTLGDLFKKEGFASSALEEKARYVYGLQENIRRGLMRIDGVVDAQVAIALPDSNPLGETPPDSSASVLIFQAPGIDLRDRETDLKVSIKDGLQGMSDVNKVTIKFFTVGSAPPVRKQVASDGGVQAALSSISPLTAGIALGVVLLLGVLLAFGSRLRARIAPPKPAARVWNG